ncbi:hypothetical protein M0805_000653 [Coniferiporia weirii]|nr:hypothetical protein M0805_000653 [Coniferiporia weirii]
MSQTVRSPFSPSPCPTSDAWKPLKADERDGEWVPVCACPADFPIEFFDAAVSQLVHHPEYNSTLILRSEIIKETEEEAEQPYEVPHLQEFYFVKNVHRTLLPRRPGRDSSIEQHCTFYAASCRRSPGDTGHGDKPPTSCLVLTPKLRPDEQMPYYHPAVHHLAFRYLCLPLGESRNPEDGICEGAQLRIEVVPQSDAPDPKDVNSRLYRTCLALLETIHRYGWGIMTNYRKRVHHDCLVSREEYQDLYLVMRERHKHLVNTWHESTDPLKHVFEDIGIATFLMLLWKQGGSAESPLSPAELTVGESKGGKMPWHTWSRPSGGFLDFGCGNGLLVHILISEGYTGEGIDVRARTSWSHYPLDTQAHLHVHALDPLDLELTSGTLREHPFLKHGSFVIANHADELSPWTSVLATLCGASGYLSIPCCPWSFDARFERAQLVQSSLEHAARSGTAFVFGTPKNTSFDEFATALRLGGDGIGKSAYSIYRIWLATLSAHCGWEVECETLRIPSTRNWAIVGRNYSGDEHDRGLAIDNAIAIIRQVRERGLFKTRRPEGKAGDH